MLSPQDKLLAAAFPNSPELMGEVQVGNRLKREASPSLSPSQTDTSDIGSQPKKAKLDDSLEDEYDEFTDGTNSSDDAPAYEKQSVDVSKSFAQVCGRLTMMNASKYPVTIGELARRIHGPEEYSFSLLGSLLRRAKMPNHTEILKNELESVGLPLERGRRRTQNLTLFGSLVEGEAIQLSKDYKHLLKTEFPVDLMANTAVAESNVSKAERIQGLNQVMKYSQEFLKIAEKDGSPTCDTYPNIVLDTDLQMQLTRFSMLTHGFGMHGIRAVMEMFQRYVEEQIKTASRD
uniref:TF_AP-2 domain-containing protein n=1 Tax=Panagrellus redivivus TaxID=6233 RepID=A0A7E4V366_PANRE